jgi:hypothetical protein
MHTSKTRQRYIEWWIRSSWKTPKRKASKECRESWQYNSICFSFQLTMIKPIKSLLKSFYFCWLLRRRCTSIKLNWNIFKTNMFALDQLKVSNNRVGKDVDRCWWQYYSRHPQTWTWPTPAPFFFLPIVSEHMHRKFIFFTAMISIRENQKISV